MNMCAAGLLALTLAFGAAPMLSVAYAEEAPVEEGTTTEDPKDEEVVTPGEGEETTEPGEGEDVTTPGEDTTVEGVEMHRLYNQWTGEHFYTANDTEFNVLVTVGWTDEGIGWVAPTEGDEVYRLYNPYVEGGNPYVEGGDHHYTLDTNEYEELQELGWEAEGVAWHSADAKAEGAVPLYRQYNPYAETGTHNYTADENENDTLVELGWEAEGIAWYGVAAE